MDEGKHMCYHVGHLDVEQSVGVLVLEDVGQSSGIALIPPQRADPAGVMLVHHTLEDLHTHFIPQPTCLVEKNM